MSMTIMKTSNTRRELNWLRVTLAAVVGLLSIAGGVLAEGTYDLLRIDPTPRGAAMGGNSVAMVFGDIGSLVINPGGLATVKGRSVLAAYADHPLDLSGGFIGGGLPLLQGYAAFGLQTFSYGDFDRYTGVDSEQQGSFAADDFSLLVGYGRELGHGISAGVTGRYLTSSIDKYVSSAVGLNLGLLWQTGVSDVDLAATVSNLGTQLESYNGISENLPATYSGGVSKKLEHLPLRLSVTARYEQDVDLAIIGGGEFVVSDMLKIRAGYTSRAADYRVGGANDSIAGLSAGFGIIWKGYRFDYGFHSQGATGMIHRLGIGASI